MDELFYFLNSSLGEVWVKTINDVEAGKLIVQYQGQDYKLVWVPQYGYYRGTVNGHEGFLA